MKRRSARAPVRAPRVPPGRSQRGCRRRRTAASSNGALEGKNRLASAAGKQDDSGVHHATAANGNQDAPVALPGPGAKDAALRRLATPTLVVDSFRWVVDATSPPSLDDQQLCVRKD